MSPRRGRARPAAPSCLAPFALAALLTGISQLPAADDAPDEVRDRPRRLSGVDLAGQLHRFADNKRCKAVAVVFLSTQCPISNGYLPLLNRTASAHKRRGVEFYGVISDPHVTREEAAAHRRQYRIAFPVLLDVSSELRRALGPSHTPQAFVLDPTGKVLYSGLIDDEYAAIGQKKQRVSRKYLRDALRAGVNGRTIDVKRTTPIGCLLEEAADESVQSDVTYARDVAPIVLAHCSGCHRPGQTAPFPLLTYADVSRHARQIAAVTGSRLMPPWKPAKDFGRFRGERRLSDREIAVLSTWANGGKPAGDAADLPPLPPAPAGGWKLGKPDLVLTMREEFELAARGADVFQHFVIPTGLPEDRLIEAVEFRPGNPRIVHHASFYLDISGAARRMDAADAGVGYGSFGGPGFPNTGSLRSWLPGMTPRRLPRGSGRFIDRQSDLVMEIHYQRSGKAETDRSSIGLHYAPRGAKRLVAEFQVLSKTLEIPAGARRHHQRATYTLPVETTLLDVAPHMHLLGREMKAAATRPDGRVEPLVWIEQWDFNWQGQYSYLRPVRLPAGTRIDVDAWYDNSEQNPLNPSSPPVPVCWGDETTDEMLLWHFQYTCDSLSQMKRLTDDHLRYLSQQEAGYRKSGRRKPLGR